MKCVGGNTVLPRRPVTVFMVCVEVHVRVQCSTCCGIHGYCVHHKFDAEAQISLYWMHIIIPSDLFEGRGEEKSMAGEHSHLLKV